MRSPCTLKRGWDDTKLKDYLVPNCVAEAAKDFDVTDDRARVVLAHVFFFSSRRRHTRYIGDWSSDVCSSDLGRNERPSWAPDGRHIVFESTRTGVGTRQIWTMLADGSQPHQLTTTGHNESPNRSEERRVGKGCRSRRLASP